MFWNNQEKGRIFISYRRADALGFAGRLSDTLEDYFGDERVFRDIEDIQVGADFGEVIHENLNGADAVIVLMGSQWLSIETGQGGRRLEQPDDWVAKEITAAFELGIPVFPVLIESTPMPRADELPERLQPLLRYNALTISDRSWDADVLRLAKILSFDIPSATQKRLDLVRLTISLALLTTLTFTAAMVVWNHLCLSCASSTTDLSLCHIWESGGPCNDRLLEHWQAGLPFVAILFSSLILFRIVDLVTPDRQRFIYASVGAGTIGTLFFFSILVLQGPREEPMIGFFGATLITTLMFSFMNLSGFEAK